MSIHRYLILSAQNAATISLTSAKPTLLDALVQALLQNPVLYLTINTREWWFKLVQCYIPGIDVHTHSNSTSYAVPLYHVVCIYE